MMKLKKQIWLVLASCLSLPWTLFILTWVFAAITSLCPELLFASWLLIHNCFLHAWPGGLALGAAAVVASCAIFEAVVNQFRSWRVFLLALDTATILLLGVYTIVWRVTGQQYDWL